MSKKREAIRCRNDEFRREVITKVLLKCQFTPALKLSPGIVSLSEPQVDLILEYIGDYDDFQDDLKNEYHDRGLVPYSKTASAWWRITYDANRHPKYLHVMKDIELSYLMLQGKLTDYLSFDDSKL